MPSQERVIKLNLPELSDLYLAIHGSDDQVISETIVRESCWEPFETSILIESLKKGNFFLDVGANIGYFTVVAASLVGENGAVFAFEPEPTNFRLILKSLSRNKLGHRVRAIRVALSNRDSCENLFLSPDNFGDHQLYPDKGNRTSTLVSLRHASRLLSGQLKRLDFVKIDTQGSEYEVLEGLVPLLSNLSKFPRMLIELTPYSLRMAGVSGAALVNLLREFDPRFWIVDHINHNLVATDADQLCQWSNKVDASSGDKGFLNIFVGESPF